MTTEGKFVTEFSERVWPAAAGYQAQDLRVRGPKRYPLRHNVRSNTGTMYTNVCMRSVYYNDEDLFCRCELEWHNSYVVSSTGTSNQVQI